MEARLRGIGATDEWVATLRRARFVAPQAPVVAAGIATTSAPSLPAKARKFTRYELRPIYFGREARMAVYASVVSPK